MKLDIECIREILLTLEAQPGFIEIPTNEFSALFPQYSHDQILYTCQKLYEGGYIHLLFFTFPGSSTPTIRCIGDLTFQGHEFLDSIKSKSTWEKLSGALKSGGSFSLKSLASVAVDVGTEILKYRLGLNHSDST